MANADAAFAGSIPVIYEQYLVPLLFAPYADDLARRATQLREGSVLEIAAGTGVVTRALRKALPPAVRIIATDLNEDMLRVGEEGVSGPSLTWQRANAQELPFEGASVDFVVCQFGVMFFPDKQASYREARRVLRPDGRYVFNVWDKIEHNEVTAIVARAVASLFPSDPPRFVERTPFAYSDVAAIREEVERAGFASVEIETVECVTRARSAAHAAVGICQGTPLRNEIEARDPARLAEATAAAADALRERFGLAEFDNRMRAHVITAAVERLR